MTLKSAFVYKIHREGVTGITLSSRKDVLFSVSTDSSLKLYDVADKRQTRSINLGDLSLSDVVVSADGQIILVSSWDNRFYTYSVETGRVLHSFVAHDDAIACMCMDSSGKFVISGSWDGVIKVWRVTNNKLEISQVPVVEFLDHDAEVRSLAIHPSTTLAASGSIDGTVLELDLSKKKCIRTFNPNVGCVNSMVYSQDGGLLVVGGANGWIRCFQVGGGEVFAVDAGEDVKCVFTNGVFVLSGGSDGILKVWSIESQELVHSVQAHPQGVAILSLCVSADLTTIVTGGDDATVNVLEIDV